jgi:hypothetical protein
MIAALAGRRIDEPDAETTRFPLKNKDLVRKRISALFKEKSAAVLISSAACGADLLAQAAAGALGLERYIILPFSRARFRKTSVTDRPGNWGKLFDKICDEVEKEGKLIVLEDFPDENEAYSAATREILNKAESLRSAGENKEEVLAVIIWEGKAKDENDETAGFAEKARAMNFKVEEILTKQED